MKIGVPREIKDNEARVAMTPEGVAKLVKSGNIVVVEEGAGLGSGFTNEQYEQAGAILALTADAWAVDLVVKVKEPQESEYPYLGGANGVCFFSLGGCGKRFDKATARKRNDSDSI